MSTQLVSSQHIQPQNTSFKTTTCLYPTLPPPSYSPTLYSGKIRPITADNRYSNHTLQSPRQQRISRDVIYVSGLEIESQPPSPLSNSYGVPLYTYQQIPPYLRGNPHITLGYRAHIPVGLCMKRYMGVYVPLY